MCTYITLIMIRHSYESRLIHLIFVFLLYCFLLIKVQCIESAQFSLLYIKSLKPSIFYPHMEPLIQLSGSVSRLSRKNHASGTGFWEHTCRVCVCVLLIVTLLKYIMRAFCIEIRAKSSLALSWHKSQRSSSFVFVFLFCKCVVAVCDG